MKPKDDHPTRERMLKAVRSGTAPFTTHLKNCAECRDLFELLSHFAGIESIKLARPSPELVKRHLGVPLLVRSQSPAESVVGSISFDSWQHLPALELRDAARGMERRVRLTAGPLMLELVAERQPHGWEFVARAYNNNKATSEFILKVGRRKLLPGRMDCYHWTAKSAPQRIQLLSPSLRVDFGTLKWRSAVTGE